jgi:uncharacterized protein (DUF58 family)
MRLPVRPSRRILIAIATAMFVVLALLLAGVSLRAGWTIAWTILAVAFLAVVSDFFLTRRSWLAAEPTLSRRLPAAFAIGVRKDVTLSLATQDDTHWRCRVYDHADSTLLTTGLPLEVGLQPGKVVDVTYFVVPMRRGEIAFEPAHVHLASRWGLCELLLRLGGTDRRRVYPDFAQIARYAWLAGDRRLQEIGIKTYRQRGEGTDFKQLSEYQHGDSVRHIDWKATLRLDKPVIREFQDERDQNVLILIDCGRRMRADDRVDGIGTAHFDQVLNAVMLLSYVALKQGDAVGAITFGTPPGEQRAFAPRKGAHALSALMGVIYAIQPTPTHSDYVAAAQDVLKRLNKRALVVVVTNFRDEDADELSLALRLLRSRHLVMLASLRERIVNELIAQPVTHGNAVLDIAAAHMYEQSRRDAFHRLAARDALMVDAEPERLGVELVNRYHAAKRAGLI